ncbi:MAG: phage holin family protein [Geodermatophilaceae bacterium]|nr:phage holin family protein [Geodermatophilaceae bacterium]
MSSPATPPRPSPVDAASEPPIGALFSAASEHISTLIRGEVALAKAELSSTAKRGAIGAGMFGAAGVMLLFSVTFLFVALAEGLVALGLPRWISYLIVWAFFVVLAGLLVFIGIRLLKKIKAPERTIETLKDSKELLSREPPGQRVAGFASNH